MEIRIAAVADGANIAAGDKLNVFGVFDTIAAAEFPVILPFMVLAIRFRLDHEDANATHKLSVSIRDNHGHEAANAVAQMTVGAIPAGGFGHVNQIMNFAGVGFAEAGVFEFRILWDGREKACADLRVVRAEAPAK